MCWYDNKVVTFLSTFVGSQPEIKAKRYIAAEKHKEIPSPKVVENYNAHMGGVDLKKLFKNRFYIYFSYSIVLMVSFSKSF